MRKKVPLEVKMEAFHLRGTDTTLMCYRLSAFHAGLNLVNNPLC